MSDEQSRTALRLARRLWPSLERGLDFDRATIWRWHFYAGTLTAPLLLVAAVTGAILAWTPELRSWAWHRELPPIDAHSVTLDLDAQWALATAATPSHHKLTALQIETQAPLTRAATQDRHFEVWIDRAHGQVLRVGEVDNHFVHLLTELHTSLFAGEYGRFVTELVASWSLVLLFTGLVLYVRRRTTRSLGRRARSQAAERGRRSKILWWHGELGIMSLPVGAIVLLTGLAMSPVCGSALRASATAGGCVPRAVLDAPTSSVVDKAHDSAAPDDPCILWNSAQRPRYSLQCAHERANPEPDAMISRITVPRTPEEPIAVLVYDVERPSLMALWYFDQYDGRVLTTVRLEDTSPITQAMYSLYSWHTGSAFGRSGRFIACLSSLALAALVLLGVWAWWARRPKGTWLPRYPKLKSRDERPQKFAATKIIIVLSFILPSVSISLLFFVLADFLLRRFSRVRSP